LFVKETQLKISGNGKAADTGNLVNRFPSGNFLSERLLFAVRF
jgi:hypothetical protein